MTSEPPAFDPRHAPPPADDSLESEPAGRGRQIVVIFLVTIGSILAFLRQKRLRRIIALKKIEVENQKHLIEEKHKEITDSINYAERIQRSFLATNQLLDDNLKNYFV